MAINREIEDIARDLIRHQHDHPPVRDLNRDVDRKLSTADRIGSDFARLVGSWIFVLAQVGLMVVWVVLNAIGSLAHWDSYPYHLLNFVLSLEAALLMIKSGDVERGTEVLVKIRQELAGEADALRQLMAGLRPPVLEERGLMPALRETVAERGHQPALDRKSTRLNSSH